MILFEFDVIYQVEISNLVALNNEGNFLLFWYRAVD